MEKAAADGQKGIAFTDHGNLGRPITLSRLCKSRGIVGVIGCEFYFVESAGETIRKFDNRRYHMVLLAKNSPGLKNLIALINKSWEDNCFLERRGLIDWKLLRKHGEGIICLTGCFWNIVSRSGRIYGEEKAEEKFQKLYDIFGSDLYSEIGRHGIREEEISNELLIKLGRKYAVKPVVTNDVHYLEKEDSRVHDCFIKSRYFRISSFSYEGRGYHLKTGREMLKLGFKKQYLENSLEILDKCSADENSFEKGDDNLPQDFNLSLAFDRGWAAFLPDIIKVSSERAEDICRRLNAPARASGELQGQFRGAVANLSRVALSVNPPLNTITPVFKCKGLRVCQFSESELKKQGVFTGSITKCKLKAPL